MSEGVQTLAAGELSLPGRLSGVSVRLQTGGVTAIVGPNGAGKSTLLGCLAGLTLPAQGGVALDGVSVAAMAPRARARLIGYLPQTPEIAWDVTVETLVRLGRLPWQGGPFRRPCTTPAEDDAAVAEAMAAMDVDALGTRTVSHLSGGERARALAARVLAGRPRWLLADEPLANLDLAHAAALIGRLKQQAASGTGVVLVLHDLAMAMNHADRVLVVNQGRIVADGTPAEVLTADTISSVWGVQARWLGETGERALAHR